VTTATLHTPKSGRASTSSRRGILFTAFEPSGDDHASVVIAELRRRHPDLPIFAWGGPRMEEAGAVLVERTGESAVMGMPGLGKIIEHVQMNWRIDDWLDQHRVALHVPVDSPDANFAICQMAKRRGIRVVHLVAPQLWAWREGRIKKLRRLTDLLLCVLPFEESWFLSRAVPARFIGHPLFNEPLDLPALDARAAAIGGGSPKLALMPGSRPSEVARSFAPLLDAYRRLRSDFPGIRATFAVTRPQVADELRRRARRLGGWPEGVQIVAGDTDAVIRWCDLALVASGTVTLQVARQNRPMVTFYRFGKIWKPVHAVLGRMLFKTQFFTLPNLIAGRRIVPELVPHFGDGRELAVEVYRLMRQPGYADEQRAALAEICRRFEGRRAGTLAADAIEGVLGLVESPG
jgi:lipid-A-disaccharide synthase